MATDSELLYEVKDRIATITLNRPDKMNAFTGPMIERWAASLNEAQSDPNVNVVIVTGAGKAFCSGGDVGRMGAGDPTPLDNKNGVGAPAPMRPTSPPEQKALPAPVTITTFTLGS